MSVPKRVWVIVAAVLGAWGLVGLSDAALAQQSPGEGQEGATTTEVLTPAAPAAPRANEIGVQIARLGIGGKARPGEWTAIQVVLTNQTDKIRSVLVRAIIPDPDGDRAAYERAIVSNPGATQSVWLYVQLPFTFDTGAALTVTAHEAEEEVDGGAASFRAGRELGSASIRFTQGNTVSATTGMMCVVGDRAAALDQYTVRQANVDYAPTGHELTDLLTLQIADIPDRVMGLLAFDTIVWTGAGQGRDPTDLSRDQAAALREWVKRGGHLVVVLPNAGQAWLGRPDNPLADLMPSASPVLFEGVDLAPMRRLLTLEPNLTLPSSFIVQTFKPDQAAGPYDAIPILSIPPDYPASGLANQPIVIRKLLGEGAVSVVGIDVGRPSLTSIRAVEADIFWNRVLGRRIDLLKPERLNKGILNLGGRHDKVLDAGIGGEIAKTAEAAAGLLLAFVVFGLYWLFAGPVGHFVLRRRDLRRHSWLAFVGIAGVFTAFAWGGASAIKAKRVSGNHLTFIDHVYGQPSQRTRSWVNIHVPRYGDVRVSAAGAKDAANGGPDDWHVSISPWDDPEAGSSGWGSFPDSREYAVESRAPEELVVPFRSTTKQFRIDWAGPVREKWGMPRPVVDGSVQLGKEIVLTPKDGPGRGWELHGKLVHDLPGDLTDVQIIVVPQQGPLDTAPDYSLVRKAVAVTLQVWRPGQVLDFDATELSKSNSGTSSIEAREWLKRLLGVPSQYADAIRDRGATHTSASDLTALSFFSMLEPPPQAQLDGAYVARRRSAHTLDLGRWFTQPCIIIVGQLADEGAAVGSPTPLTVDGRDVQLRGRTVVRWVYPLAADPPEYGPRLEAPSTAGPEAATPPTEPEAAPAPPPQGRRRR